MNKLNKRAGVLTVEWILLLGLSIILAIFAMQIGFNAVFYTGSPVLQGAADAGDFQQAAINAGLANADTYYNNAADSFGSGINTGPQFNSIANYGDMVWSSGGPGYSYGNVSSPF